MDAQAAPQLDLSTRFRRSQGRSGRTCAITLKVTQEELNELNSVAKSAQRALGEWAREVLLSEARKPERDPVFTEVVAMRLLLNLTLKHLLSGETITGEAFSAILTKVRDAKRKQSQELMQQYMSADGKES